MFMGRDSRQQNSCMNILNTMYKIMRQARMCELQTHSLAVKKSDLCRLLSKQNKDKYQMEKSYAYIGYKFLWIIQMFLDGKRFPYGDLTEAQWRQHVVDIVNFVSTDEYLSELLDFDPSLFFRVISKLFTGKPWLFVSLMDESQTECNIDPVEHLLPMFETRGKKAKQLQ